MSHPLISRSADLKRLRDDGYNIDVVAGYLVMIDIPYLTSRKEVKRGALISTLALAGDVTTRPDTHVIHFAGEYPCQHDGSEIEKIRNESSRRALVDGLVIDHTFSAKPTPAGYYEDYYAKMTTYALIFEGPARSVEPNATARSYPAIPSWQGSDSVFNYIDTASSRAEIEAISQKVAGQRIALVGGGGTAAYLLDFVAKTPVAEIHIFDGDTFLQHNAFRAPGAPTLEQLQARPSKVAYLAGIYSRMRRGIVPHECYVGVDNVELLRQMDVVFLCLDRGTEKRVIVQKLEEFEITFIDVGMGLYVSDGALGGIVRVTTSTPAQRAHVASAVPFSDGIGHNEYAQNIQIAELNALNAALAVLKWKKLCGVYLDVDHEHQTVFTLIDNAIVNEEKHP